MRRHVRSGLVGLLLVAAAVPGVLAAAPQFWVTATQADFLRGEAEQLTLDEHGRLSLGAPLSQWFDAGTAVAWDVLPTTDGGAWVATGNEGQLFRVDANGKGRMVFDAGEVGIHALAGGPAGSVFVATSPDGRVYRVSADGTSGAVFDPDEKYIWALAVDAEGRLLASTGDPQARVYRIASDGTSELLYTAPATHATALLPAADGTLLVGTDSPGRIYRVDARKRPFLMADTGFREVRRLRRAADGTVYALALTGRSPAPLSEPKNESLSAVPTPMPVGGGAVVASVTVVEVAGGVASSTTPTRETPGVSTGAVFHIAADGDVTSVWSARDDVPYDLVVDGEDGLLLATGPRGKLYRLSGSPLRARLLGKVASEQVVAIARASDRWLLATANPGGLSVMGRTAAVRGSYTSDVRDAGGTASWGAVAWRAVLPPGGRVSVETRSGNTGTPDEAWSEWAPVREEADGASVASPRARYLQWRATLTATGASPTLSAVTVAYRPRNERPDVAAITVYPAGVVFQKPYSTGEAEIAGLPTEPADKRLALQGQPPPPPPAPGRRLWQRGLQTLGWKAEDPNGDPLEFTLAFRRDGEQAWTPLAQGLDEPLFVWDTATVANGVYTVRVTATDRQAHGEAEALRGDRDSDAIVIDNTAPVVTLGTPRRDATGFVLPIEATDRDTAVLQVEASVDGQAWQPVRPPAGMLDARLERLELRLGPESAGRTVVIRVTDALQNAATASVVVPGAR